MEKRLRPALFCAGTKQHCAYTEEDRISSLPDELLLIILSLLTKRDAARTSALSSRWRRFWRSVTSNLEFYDPQIPRHVFWGRNSLRELTPKYLEWVNQTLEVAVNKFLYIDEFRICFQLDASSGENIDKWIDFAIQKRVQKLELDFSFAFRDSYGFPGLGWITSRPRHNCFMNKPLDYYFASFDSLRFLALSCIEVSEEVINYFLTNCPLLEHLRIEYSSSLVVLKIGGPSLKLKHLEILHCSPIKKVEVFNMNLISFKLVGTNIKLHLWKLPLLVDLHLGMEQCESLIADKFLQLSSYSSQLKQLTLHTAAKMGEKFPKYFPTLGNLEYLEFMNLCAKDEDGLLSCISVINASRMLRELVLKIVYIEPSEVQRKVRKLEKCPHNCIKTVKLAGFVGLTSDVELAFYLLQNAVSLQKMIIDPSNPAFDGTPLQFKETEEKQLARRNAKVLEERLPSGVELVVL